MRELRWSALIVLAACAGCNRSSFEPPRVDPTEVAIARPIERKITDYKEFTGHTDARRSVEIKARVTGYLRNKYFQDGQDVRQGDLLYEIDDRPYKAVLDSAEAQVARDEAHRSRLSKDYQRASSLFQRAAIGKQEFDLLSSDYAEAEAQLGASKAQLENARLNMSFTKVVAPMAGQLSRTLVDPGNLVRQDMTVLNDVVSTDTLYAYFDLSVDAMEAVMKEISAGLIGSKDGKKVQVYVGTTLDADRYEDAMRRLQDIDGEIRQLIDLKKKAVVDAEAQMNKLAGEAGGVSKILASAADPSKKKGDEDLDSRARALDGLLEALKARLAEGRPDADPAALDKHKKLAASFEGLRKKLGADLADKDSAIAQKRKRLAEEEKLVPPEFPYKGDVDFAENKLDAATGTLRVRGEIKNDESALIPGLFVRVRLPIGLEHKALLLPEDSIGSDQGRTFIYVINPKDEVEYRPIELGALYEGEAGRKLRAVKGVEAGERFIQDSETIRRVRPGAKVKAIESTVQVAANPSATAS